MSFPRYPTYKDSGVEWLGEVPEHWEILPCRGIVDERTEKNEGAVCQDYLSLMANVGIIPYEEKGDVGNKKPEDLSKCKLVRKGDFVINSMNYGIGSYGVSGYDGVCSPVYIVLIPIEEEVRPGFAFRIFEDKTFQSHAQSFGNGILAHRCAIGWDILKGIGVPIPSAHEQEGILQFLDRETTKIDALIAQQQRLIELLKEKRQAVISHAVSKGLNPNAPMKGSGVEWLGKVPEHWEHSKLSKLTTKIGDGLHGTPEYVEESEFYFVNGNNLNAGAIVFSESTRRVCKRELEKHWVDLNNTTLLMSINGTIGNFALYRGEPIMLGKSASYINCNECISREYLSWVVQSFGARCYFVLCSSGTTISNLGLGAIKSMPVAVPPFEEQESINDFLANFSVEYDRLVHEAELAVGLLQERRSSLISAAVTGQIDVRGLATEEEL